MGHICEYVETCLALHKKFECPNHAMGAGKKNYMSGFLL